MNDYDRQKQQSAGIRLRSARTEDVPALTVLWQTSILQVCSPWYPDCQEWIRQWAESKNEDAVGRAVAGEEFFIVAVRQKQICGFFCCTFSLGTFALFVDPHCLHQGIGKRLFSCYERLAVECHVNLLSFNSSRNAVSFYERCGCKQIKRDDRDFPVPDRYTVPMIKHLPV